MGIRVECQIVLGDVSYDVSVEHFRGSPSSYDDPGDGGETYPDNIVSVTYASGAEDVTTFGVLLLEYACYFGSKILSEAEDRLLDDLHAQAETYAAESEDDR
jgi:hypothetical protein